MGRTSPVRRKRSLGWPNLNGGLGRSAPVDLDPDVGLVERERDLPFGDLDFFMTSGPPWA
ncbi:MAG: hypothetical protein QOE30_1074 [Mycobacterium sp.]|nr:hypothetical protein [Mycobacterium sp.]